MLTAMNADMCSKCLVTDPWVRSFTRRSMCRSDGLPSNRNRSDSTLSRSEAELGVQCAGARAHDRVTKMSGYDCDSGSDIHGIEKMRHIARTHPNATIT